MHYRQRGFAVDPSWSRLLRELGVSPENTLRRAGLPSDLFTRPRTLLRAPSFFALWQALEHEARDPLLALHLGESLTADALHAPLFAALCSDDLRTALFRIADFDGISGPLTVRVDEVAEHVVVMVVCLDELARANAPLSLLLWKLVFTMRLARMGTREPLYAKRVTLPSPVLEPDYVSFFGVPIETAPVATLSFSASDARQPFMARHEHLWRAFESGLKLRLRELPTDASAHDRVRAALLELLPSGQSSLDDVSRRLAVGKRTLQRQLKLEGHTFQALLDAVRTDLARHYLRTSKTFTEIAFLLGFADPNSFFRAFHDWTGQTPEAARSALLAAIG